MEPNSKWIGAVSCQESIQHMSMSGDQTPDQLTEKHPLCHWAKDTNIHTTVTFASDSRIADHLGLWFVEAVFGLHLDASVCYTLVLTK